MLLRLTPLVVALLLMTATAASAQLTFEHRPKKDPYRNLFGERDLAQKIKIPVRVISRATPQKPFVVCGTVIVPADPKADPKMRVGPPDDGMDYKLRIVKPPICKPE